MAIVTLKRPIAEARGILKKRDRYYIRMLDGQCIVQRRPKCYSEKQRAMRKAFGARYSGSTKSRRSPDEVP